MRIRGYRHLEQGARWLRSRAQRRRALILGYHRVSEAASDPFSLTVSPSNFAAQLRVLHHVATPISLVELVQRLQNGELPPRAVALTMDDGYADNLYEAQPLLEMYDIPATIFVISGYLGKQFWWDELTRLIFTKGAFENDLSLKTTIQNVEWQPKANWSVQKQQKYLFKTLYKVLRSLPEGERQESMERLRDWVGNDVVKSRHRALTRPELSKLADCPLIEIGSHTHTHPVLTDLPQNEQQAEIRQGKAHLEALLERRVVGISYPNGSSSTETQSLVKEAGFDYACTSNSDITWRGSDPFCLPRFWIPDWNGAQFSQWLQRWL